MKLLFTRCALLIAIAASALVTLSALAQPVTPANEIVTPNANLHIEGIPPIPKVLADSVARYADFRGHRFIAWHPKKQEMIVAHRAAGSSTNQLFSVKSAMGELTPITNHADPISGATIEPTEGKYIVFEASKGGSEAFQMFRQDVDGQPAAQITDSNFRHSRAAWRRINDKPTGELLFSSVPLDRNLSAEQKTNIATTYRLIDPKQPDKSRVVAELPGTGWFGGSFDRAGNQILLTRYVSANESEVWIHSLDTGQRERVLPASNGAKSTYFAGRFSRDGKGIFVVSDRDGEFRELMFYDLKAKTVKSLTRGLPYDVEDASEDDEGDDDGSRIIYTRLNVKGKNELRAYDSATFKEVAIKGVPDGTIRSVSTRRGSAEIVLNVVSARSPGDVYALNPMTGARVPWTKAASPMDMSNFKSQDIITWKSFDGREISGLINRAPSRFTGKRPVVINIHGGPEAQAKIGFSGRWNYFVDELGITVIAPNVRGSSGFGKTFLDLDNGYKREDSVKDIGALLDWVATQPDLDASRVLVTGGSYGGYMSLAVSTNYPDRIAGAIDVVGISHFVTFLETTESYRRDLRRVEYGDERDPKMREFLNSISPLTNAHKIKKPLLVVQGKNDPRVPYTEAEQIVARARANGSTVWYLRAENEGHGFARRENADYYFYSMVRFMQDTILK